MPKANFEKLSSLVLVDAVAALPMEHVMRLASLAHQRLRQTCSLKWVKDRMTDVSLEQISKAHQTSRELADTFCTNSVVKILNGKLVIRRLGLENVRPPNSFAQLSEQNTGKFYLNVQNSIKLSETDAYDGLEMLRDALITLPYLIYLSQTQKRGEVSLLMMQRCPGMIFNYRQDPDESYHSLQYRPALLNGRHPVDVLRAICGPTDVSEAELDRVRRTATERAREVEPQGMWQQGMSTYWFTYWKGGAVTRRKGGEVTARKGEAASAWNMSARLSNRCVIL